jgi:hypothetical protein
MLLVIWYNFRNKSDGCDADFIYEEDETLKYFASEKEMITAEVLTSWYTSRVHQIENRSCMVDHALTLIKLAKERNIMVSPEMCTIYCEQIRKEPRPLSVISILYSWWMTILKSFLSSHGLSFSLSASVLNWLPRFGSSLLFWLVPQVSI